MTGVGVTYIYGLCDPRTGSIRYVGKSNNPKQRLQQQICRAKNHPTTHLDSWIRGLDEVNIEPDQIILDTVSMLDWKAAEAAWMAEMILLGNDLVNLAAGGEGPTFGHEQSDAEKVKRSISMKKRYEDPAERIKTGNATRKALANPQAKQRLSDAGKIGYASSLGKLSPEERNRNASRAAKATHKEKYPDGRSKHAVMLGKVSNAEKLPDGRSKNAVKGGKKGGQTTRNSTKAKQKIGLASKERWQDPEYRQRLSNSQKSVWAKKSPEELSAKAYKAWETRRKRQNISKVNL